MAETQNTVDDLKDIVCRFQVDSNSTSAAQYKASRLEQLQRYASQYPYAKVGCPYSYKFTDGGHEVITPAQFIERFETSPTAQGQDMVDTSVTIAVTGRLMSIRASGRALRFLDIQGDGKVLQVLDQYNRRFGEEAEMSAQDWIDMHGILGRGDIIGVIGHPGRNRRGVLVLVPCAPIELLTPCLVMLPNGPYSLSDPEQRCRFRFMDLTVRPDSRFVAITRSKFIFALQRFLRDRRFLEVETPILNAEASGASARPFVTHHNEMNIDMTLRIAPELYLKELVVGGIDRVFEIGRNFRNEGMDRTHNPEYTSLEAYWAYADYTDMKQLTIDMLQQCVREVMGTLVIEHWSLVDLGRQRALLGKLPREGVFTIEKGKKGLTAHVEGGATVNLPAELADVLQPGRRYRRNVNQEIVVYERTIDFTTFGEVKMLEGISSGARELVAQYQKEGKMDAATAETALKAADFIEKEDPDMPGDDYAAACRSLLKALGLTCLPPLTIKRMLDQLCESLVEDRLDKPTFVMNHPCCMSPLAKPSRTDPRVSERFELFLGGFEVCNAYTELNDPAIQRKNFMAQAAAKAQGDDEACGVDETFLSALDLGLPPTTGIGFGIDRLVMLLTGRDTIRDVILFLPYAS